MDTNVNRKHKDSVFSALFSTPEILRELYSAIEGIDVPPDAIVDINTLSDALYMKQINDLSFTINDRVVVLVEHQSTINENVPVRLLMYAGRVYEKIVDREKLYHKKLEQIPTPEFIVLYNGKEPCPECQTLRLSTAFKDLSGLKLSECGDLPLELVVQVYNINHGYNAEILKRSKNLNEYSLLMGKINEYNEKLPIEESVTNAVKYCIEHGILKEFLKKHGSEVVNMLFEELSLEEIVAIRSEEAAEEAREKAFIIGHAEGHAVGRGERNREIALNLLAEGSSPDFIQKVTGLSVNDIK